jgi:cell wall-associated NlpC family hydrolase
MPTIGAPQIAAYAYQAGFRAVDVVTATAIALAESDGKTDAVNVNSDQWHSRDRGLWQINDHYHPEWTDAQCFDPATCARAAYRISGGGHDFTPWATYNNGAYRKYLNDAGNAANNIGVQGQRSGPSSSLNSSGDRVTINTAALAFDPVAPLDIGDMVIMGLPANQTPVPGVPVTHGAATLDGLISTIQVELSIDQVSQVTVTVEDAALAVFTSGLLRRGTHVHWIDSDWEVSSIAIGQGSAGPQTVAIMRSWGAQQMRKALKDPISGGPGVWTNVSATDLMARICEGLNLQFVGEASATRGQIVLLDPTQGGKILVDPSTGTLLVPETLWDLGKRLAMEQGFVAFEAAGIYYFGRPTWLVQYMTEVRVSIRGEWGDPGADLIETPSVSRSYDDLSGLAWLRNVDTATMTAKMDRKRGMWVRPGMFLNAKGLGPDAVTPNGATIQPADEHTFSGSYYVTDCNWTVDGNQEAIPVISATRPVDPIASIPALQVSSQTPGTTVSDFVTLALAQIGKGYQLGATPAASDTNPTVFDCSSLVQWCAARVGLSLPRTSDEQKAACKAISIQQASTTRGALLFISGSGASGHVGVSCGDGTVVEDVGGGSRRGVQRNPLSFEKWDSAGLINGMDYNTSPVVLPPAKKPL